MIVLVAASLLGPGLVTAAATPPAVIFSVYGAGDTRFMGFPSLYNGSSTNG